jgi:stress response protein YsnF
MNLSPEERAVCERELEQGGYLLIARVEKDVDSDLIVSLLKDIPRDGLGKSDGRAQPPGGDYMGFRVEDPASAAATERAAPAAPAARTAPAATAPVGSRVGAFEGFRVEDPNEARAAPAPVHAAAAPPLQPATETGDRRVGAWEGFRVEDPKAQQAAQAAQAPVKEELAEERIPIVEEELRIGTREVVRGGARVHAHVEEHPVQQEVELFAERTSVERRPTTRKLSEEELERGGLLRERVIEISEMREEAVVSKQAFVREELIVKKTIERRVEQIDETVRRTEVETERLPGGESRPAFSGFASSNVREPEQR